MTVFIFTLQNQNNVMFFLFLKKVEKYVILIKKEEKKWRKIKFSLHCQRRLYLSQR